MKYFRHTLEVFELLIYRVKTWVKEIRYNKLRKYYDKRNLTIVIVFNPFDSNWRNTGQVYEIYSVGVEPDKHVYLGKNKYIRLEDFKHKL